MLIFQGSGANGRVLSIPTALLSQLLSTLAAVVTVASAATGITITIVKGSWDLVTRVISKVTILSTTYTSNFRYV